MLGTERHGRVNSRKKRHWLNSRSPHREYGISSLYSAWRRSMLRYERDTYILDL